MRDAIGELIRYNQRFVGDGREPRWLAAKLDRLCASPFGFPELFVITVGREHFPVVWSIIGAALFVAIVHLLSGGRD